MTSIIYGVALEDSSDGTVLVSLEPQSSYERPELEDDEPDWQWGDASDGDVDPDDADYYDDEYDDSEIYEEGA